MMMLICSYCEPGGLDCESVWLIASRRDFDCEPLQLAERLYRELLSRSVVHSSHSPNSDFSAYEIRNNMNNKNVGRY